MKIRIRALTPFQLTAHDIQNWLDLESRALEYNIYLSPHFVIPAIRYLDPGKKVLLLFVERIDSEHPKMMGFVMVTMNLGNKTAPGPYLDTYQSRHSFLGTPLIDRAHAPQVIPQLLRYLSQRFRHFIGMVWNGINLDGELAQLLYDAIHKLQMEFEVIDQFARPILVPQYCIPGLIKTELVGLEKAFFILPERMTRHRSSANRSSTREPEAIRQKEAATLPSTS